jgi:diketogulonate reductase-like aldo/keto reductase
MIHAPRAINIPIQEVVEEIDKLIDAGKAKYLGVSNFNVEQLKLVQKVARHKLSGHEIHYNLMIRANEENGVVDYCEKNNILMTVFQPIRRGFLVGLEDKLLKKLSEKYKKTQVQIMLNWLANKKSMMFLIKATKGSHINENVAALGWKMDKKDYELLDKWRMPGYVTPEYDKTGCAKDGIKIDKL